MPVPPAPPRPRLPASGPERERLRATGQFWTPAWVAEAMATYVLAAGATRAFDPAVGDGAFFRALRAVARGRALDLAGREVDPAVLAAAEAAGVPRADLAAVELKDFVLDPPGPLEAVVANPPYLRHHRIPPGVKHDLGAFGRSVLGRSLDARTGLHVFFLLRTLTLLVEGGRLAFIVPADTVEGLGSGPLWAWVSVRFALDAVVTFAPEATPFPGVDTNAVVLLVRRASPARTVRWARCMRAGTPDLGAWIRAGFRDAGGDLDVHERDLEEALATGLSRPPPTAPPTRYVLGDYARVVRGIATGDNAFFFLTRAGARALGIPEAYLRPAIGRTRDLPGERKAVTAGTLDALDAAGRPTLLLSLDGRPVEALPPPVRAWLEEGVRRGVPERPLVAATRRPWYRMEVREPPPLLFAYLGRRHARFVRNEAGVVPLTGFLCVYPHASDPASLGALWRVLAHPATEANLARVGKSYGKGAIKVEPRALERLPLPDAVVEVAGLPAPVPPAPGPRARRTARRRILPRTG